VVLRATFCCAGGHSCQSSLGREVVIHTHTVSTRRLAVTFGPQLIALVTGPADAASHGARGCSAACAVVKHCSALVAGGSCNGPVGVGHAVRLDHGLAAGQDMSVLVELQGGVLRGVGEGVEW
jgi:hypothetical protein